ncbi:MAG: histidine phosphatase family protein [Bdellovibrionaceae bacterium]|nr:histidine phosphatase family protein [Pseudobdellovibrionaceae bacterium]
MNKVLYLVRHGLTDWNVQKKMQGHSNIPLNDTGKLQAKSLQDFFINNPVEHIFSSDLDRAYQTIEIATSILKPTPVIQKLSAFREVNLGAVEGTTMEEILEKYGAKSWEQWISLDPGANFSYPGGETHQESLKRSLEALEFVFTNFNFRAAAACTHGLLIRRLGHHLRPDMTDILPIPNCGVFEVRWDNNKPHFKGLIFSPEDN